MALGGLPREKMHCSVMGREALEAAVANYRGQTVASEEEDEGRLVCRCFAIHENKIRRHVIENRLQSVEDVTNFTKAGGGCTSCHIDIQDIIDSAWNNELAAEKKQEPEAKPATPIKLTNVQKIMKIQQLIEEEIKPALIVDGGSVELVDVEGEVVKVKFHGACSTCPARGLTMKGFVERLLQQKVMPELQIEEVS